MRRRSGVAGGRGRGARVWGVALLVVLAGWLGGCQKEERIGDEEVRRVRTLVETGLQFEGDPYVRAETARLLELMDGGEAVGRLEGLLEDPSPMVRLAALRSLFGLAPERAEKAAGEMFESLDPRPKRALLEIVLARGSDALQRDLLHQAIQTDQPRQLRLHAFREGLRPRVRRAIEAGGEGQVRKLFLSTVSEFVYERDPVLGGPVLGLMAELGEADRAETLVETVANRDAPVERRLAAARVLADAGAGVGTGVFERIVERAGDEGGATGLALPTRRTDPRLVRAAVLGLAAAGETAYVARAKGYLQDASAEDYVEVLEALASNPAEGARLALETALVDARPRVRHRAIELYARRDDTRVQALLDVLANQDFERGMAETRLTIAELLGERYPKAWVPRLKGQLHSSEGILPALELMIYVIERTGNPKPVELLRDRLLEIARAGRDEQSPRAAYLLVELAEDAEVRELLESVDHPMPRYRYLEWIAGNAPEKHVDFLLEHFYQQDDAMDRFVIRLVAGIGLMRAKPKLDTKDPG